jgi:hypothetical protein
MTDFRALIADDAFAASFQSLGQYRTALLAALAQPEPQGPTDAELDELAEEYLDWNADGIRGYARAVLARWGRPAIEPVPEPQGPPKNCWLDDEPYLCPSPCVFDDPSEVIDNCLEARHLSEKNKPKEACKYYRTTAQPEPVVLTRPDCFNFAMDFLGGTEEVEVRNYIERLESAARAVLAQPEPLLPSELELEAIELKLWDKHRTKGYMGEEFMYDNDFSAALDEYRGLLAQPEPQGPTQAELRTFACKWWHSFGFVKNKATCTWVIDQIAPEHFVDFSRDLLARWGRPAIEPVPKREDVHYAWELHDAEGEWQAGGSANSLEDVQREGNRYLQTYSQDGPHKLIIERHCVTTIEPVPKREAEQ